jgi:hypothetical protein
MGAKDWRTQGRCTIRGVDFDAPYLTQLQHAIDAAYPAAQILVYAAYDPGGNASNVYLRMHAGAKSMELALPLSDMVRGAEYEFTMPIGDILRRILTPAIVALQQEAMERKPSRDVIEWSPALGEAILQPVDGVTMLPRRYALCRPEWACHISQDESAEAQESTDT